jgi:fluoroquinolone resistance protein
VASKPPIEPAAPDLPEELGAPPELPDVLARGELEACLLERLDLSERDASLLTLVESRLLHVDLTGARLQNATLRDVAIEEGSWANAGAANATLRRMQFEGVRLTGADLGGASIEDAAFVECRIDLASFRAAKLTRVRFERCRMEEADFQAATLSSCLFEDCTLTRAVLAEATFARSELRGCDLAGVGNPERLRGVRMPWADVVNAAAELAEATGIEIVD